MRNDRADYKRTNHEFRARLRKNWNAAVSLVGEETARRFEKYFRISAVGFGLGTTNLYRLTFRRLARPLCITFLIFIVIVSVWTPLAFDRIGARWFSVPNMYYLAPIPLLTLALAVMSWRGIRGPHPGLAFVGAVGLFVMAFIGLVISTMPYMVPPTITLWQAAAAPKSQSFILAGMSFLVPVILGYTVFVYRTFRGKIRPGEGYH